MPVAFFLFVNLFVKRIERSLRGRGAMFSWNAPIRDNRRKAFRAKITAKDRRSGPRVQQTGRMRRSKSGARRPRINRDDRNQFVTVKLMFENEIWACRAVNSPA